MIQHPIGFIGAGNMARSIVGGLLDADYPSSQITAADPDTVQREAFKSRLGVKVLQDNVSLVSASKVVVLAVKPQVMADVLKPLAGVLGTEQPLVISIAAGIRVDHIQKWAQCHLPVVRVMPNTPALVRSGASALFASDEVSNDQRGIAESVMRAVGVTVWLPEEALLDQVTALSGSGPAYFFYLMEALEDAAVAAGLDVETARLLTLETALGAAKLALESRQAPAELRRHVTSPGGTTEQAINSLESANAREVVAQAFAAAQRRSKELGDIVG